MPPTTPQERAWVTGIVKLRQRIDRVLLPGMTLTHAKLEELSDVSRTCRPGLAKLGQRLRPAHQRGLRARRDYERAGSKTPQGDREAPGSRPLQPLHVVDVEDDGGRPGRLRRFHDALLGTASRSATRAESAVRRHRSGPDPQHRDHPAGGQLQHPGTDRRCAD